MRGRLLNGSHFVETNMSAQTRRLPRRFDAGKTTPNDDYFIHVGVSSLRVYFFVAFLPVLVALLFFPVSFLAPVFFAARLLAAAFGDFFFAGLLVAFAALDDCLPVNCFLDRFLT